MKNHCSPVVSLCCLCSYAWLILLLSPYPAISSDITSDGKWQSEPLWRKEPFWRSEPLWQSFTNTDFVRGIAIGNLHVFAATTMGINQYYRDTRAWEKTLTTTNGLL
ncbi:MAG: hypothetical protein QME81_20880, partial [bacterium]|nr:hypothetical protein [bacterium]